MAPFPPRKNNFLSSVPHLRMTFNTVHLSSLERQLQSILTLLPNTDFSLRIHPTRRDLHDIDTIIHQFLALVKMQEVEVNN